MPSTNSSLPGLLILEQNSKGYIALVRGDGTPSTLALGTTYFAVGCIYVDTTTGLMYLNVGTVAAPVWRNVEGSVNVVVKGTTIATTSTTDEYIICPETGVLSSVDFSSLAALTQDGTNFITWTVTNLGQAGSGSTAMLAAVDANTTKTTTGKAIAANTKLSLTLSATAANLVVAAGDRLLVRASAGGTLANTVTAPVYCFRFAATA